MSESDTTPWKPFFWLTLATLIGVYVLYEHYAGTLKEQLSEAEASLRQSSRTLADIEQTLSERTEAAATARGKIDELSAEHQGALAALDLRHRETLAERAQRHEDAIATLHTTYGQTISETEQRHEDALAALQEELAAAKRAADGLQQERDALAEAKTSVEQQLQESTASLSTLRERLVELSEVERELQAKLEADNETIAGLNFQLNAANQLEAALRDKLERGGARQEELQTLVQKEEAAIEELKSKLVETQQRRRTVESKIADGGSQAAGGQQPDGEAGEPAIAELREQLSAAIGERNALADRLRQAAAEADEARRAQAELRQQYEQGKAGADDLSAEVQRLSGALRDKEAALAEAEKALTDAEAAARDSAASEAETLSALQAANARLAETQAALEQARVDAQAQAAAHEQALAELRSTTRESLSRVQSLYDGAAALGGELTAEGIRFRLGGDAFRFPSGSADVPEQGEQTLDRLAELLQRHADLRARIEGHTDSTGSAAVNQRLSQQRAEAVMQGLIERGIGADRVSATGYGPERPIASNTTAAGQRANRRVDIYVTE
jgi:outer membrane protein OmpA-like peptidoglycan-associated protein